METGHNREVLLSTNNPGTSHTRGIDAEHAQVAQAKRPVLARPRSGATTLVPLAEPQKRDAKGHRGTKMSSCKTQVSSWV